jgi:hypothetical protein
MTDLVVQPAPVVELVLQTGQGPRGIQGIQGIQGLQGLPGAIGSDLRYTHTQASASAFWTVDHNLAKYPAVQVFDSAGSEVEGDTRMVSPNQLTIEFSAPFSGVAYCN